MRRLVAGLLAIPLAAVAGSFDEDLAQAIQKHNPPILIGPDFTSTYLTSGSGFTVTENVTAEGTSLIVQTHMVPANSWDMQIRWPMPLAVKRGDTLMAIMRLRSLEPENPVTGEGLVNVRMAPEIRTNLAFGSDCTIWAPIFTVWDDFAAGGDSFRFQFGFQLQKFEILEVRLYNFGAKVTTADLPQPWPTGYSASEDLPIVLQQHNPIETIAVPFNNNFALHGSASSDLVVEQLTDPEHGNYLRIDTPYEPAVPWDMQLWWSINTSFQRGDTMMASFWARSASPNPQSGKALLNAYLQTPAKWFRKQTELDTQWRYYHIVIPAFENLSQGTANLVLHLGHPTQAIDIAGMQFYKFPSHVLQYDLFQPVNLCEQDLEAMLDAAIAQYNPTLISPADFTLDYALWGSWKNSLGVGRVITDVGPALRLTHSQQPPNPWDIQLAVRSVGNYQRGDTLMAVMRMRSIVPGDPAVGESKVSAFFQAPDKWLRWNDRSFGDEWTFYAPSFTALDDASPGSGDLTIHLGYLPQTIEIADVRIYNFGKLVAQNELPQPSSRYNLVDDSDWKPAAAARIEDLRKSDITLRLEDSNGQVIPNKNMRILMQQHAFPFGTAVSEWRLTRTDSIAETYRQLIPLLFNSVTPETSMKWKNWEFQPERALTLANFALVNDLRLYGHTLVWPSRAQNPHLDPNMSASDLRTGIENFINDIVGQFEPQIQHWEVLNEPYTNFDWMDLLGNQEMLEWFELARQAAPDAQLVINEFGILTGGGLDNEKQSFYRDLVHWLQNTDAPIGGIGMQSHFDGQVTPIHLVLQILDDFGSSGLPILITEYDMAADEATQASYLRDFLTAAFSHPSVESFSMWGFWDGQHWRADAGILDHDFSMKTNGSAYLDLVYGDWWTDLNLASAGNGNVTFSGFHGDYLAYLTHNGVSYAIPFSLPKDGPNELTIRAESQYQYDGVVQTRRQQIEALIDSL